VGVVVSTLGAAVGVTVGLDGVFTLGTAGGVAVEAVVVPTLGAAVATGAVSRTGCIGGAGGSVQRCRAVATFSNALRVVSPASRDGTIVVGGFVSKEMMSNAACCRKSSMPT
jgi:hypothetical protein